MDQDPRHSAKTAREGLARGLSMLQDPSLPPPFLAAAEPIARAMGLLMQIERSDGSPPAVRPVAEHSLAAVRDALARLQQIPSGNATAEQVMATVAASLSTVHGLTRYGDAQQAPQQQLHAPPVAQFAPPAPQYQAPAQPQYQAPQQPQYQQPPASNQFHPQQGPPQVASYAQPPVPQFQGAPPVQAYAPPPGPQPQAPALGYRGPSQGPTQGLSGDSVPPPTGTIEAELGAHSPSNFYKTLSGNDIVDHGGIFVSTYNIPKIGQRVMLRVHMPGGYHFDCQGLVKWTREGADNPDAPPGFGAQFHGITPDQRGLVQRYVRNREPLFYDDL